MKSRFLPMVFVAFLAVSWAAAADPDGPEAWSANAYVGAVVCKGCHGPGSDDDVFTVWSVSKHSRTWVQLGSRTIEMIDPSAEGFVPEALGGPIVAEARRLGIDTDCLECHTTANGVDADRLEATFHPEDGVQCEACHGPGRRHVDAMAAPGGDDPVERAPGSRMRLEPIENCTRSCHRPKPTHEPFLTRPFVAEKAWLAIAHGPSRR